MKSIESPYSIEYTPPTTHRPIVMVLNPDTFEWNQIMLTDEQSKDIAMVIFDTLAVNGEMELTVQDEVYLVHKKNRPIKQHYTQQEIDEDEEETTP